MHIYHRLPALALLVIIFLFRPFQAEAQFTLVGDAQSLGGNCYLLSDTVIAPSGSDWKSAVWNNTPLDLTNGFDIKLFVSFTSAFADSGLAADGMAFVLQNTGLGAISTNSGNSLGYGNTTPWPTPVPCPGPGPFVGGITPSLAVELDLWDNRPVCVTDDGPDHIAVVRDGDYYTGVLGPIVPAMTSQSEIAGPLNQYRCREFRITYEPVTDTIRVYYDSVLRIKFKLFISGSVFSVNPIVNWGFTGASGSVRSHTIVCTEFAVAGPDEATCQNDTVSITASGGVSYNWTSSAGLSCSNCQNPVATPTMAGPNEYIVTVTNYAGCNDTASLFVTGYPAPVVDAGPDPAPFCIGGSATLTGTSGSGHVFSWLPTTGLSSPGTLVTNASPSTTTMYYLYVTDTITKCTGIDSVEVVVGGGDSAVINTPNTIICLGDTITLSVTSTPGIDTWAWSPATGLSSTSIAQPKAFPVTTTTYILNSMNSVNGCTYVDSITISVGQVILDSLMDATICRGDTFCFNSYNITGTGPYSYQWSAWAGDSISDSSAANPCIWPSDSTGYTLIVTDIATGCSDTAEVNIAVNFVEITADPTSALINPGQPVFITTVGGVSWSWSPDENISCITCPDPIANPNSTTTYTVTGYDSVGCSGTATVEIMIDSLKVPNVFTPNGDGINDVLLINYLGPYVNFEAAIFDRWGKQMYLTKDPTIGWDGRDQSGNDAPPGVYYLLLRIQSDEAIPNKDKNSAFHVTLMR